MQAPYWSNSLLAWLLFNGLVPENISSLDEVHMLKVYKKFARRTNQKDLAKFLAIHYPLLGCIITDPLHFYSLLLHFCHVNNLQLKTRADVTAVHTRLQQRVSIFCQLLPRLGAAINGQSLTRAIDLINRRQSSTVAVRKSSTSSETIASKCCSNYSSDQLVSRMHQLLAVSKSRLQQMHTFPKQHQSLDAVTARLFNLKNLNATQPALPAAKAETQTLLSKSEVQGSQLETQLKVQLEDAERSKTKMRQEKTSLQRQLEEKQSQMQNAQAEQKLLQTAYNKLLQEHETLQQQLQQNEAQWLQSEEKLRNNLHNTEKTLLDQQARISAQQEEMKQELYDSNQHATQLQAAIDQLQKQLLKEQQTVKTLMQQLLQERCEKQELQIKCRHLEMQLQRAQCAHDSDKCAAHFKQQQLINDFEDISSEFVELRGHNTLLNTELERLQAENMQLQQQHDAQHLHVQSMQIHIQTLMQQLTALCEEREAQFSKQHQQMAELETFNEQLLSERRQIQVGLTRVDNMQKALVQEVSSNVQQITDTITAGQALDEHCSRLQLAYKQLRRRLEDKQLTMGYSIVKFDEILESNRELQYMLHNIYSMLEDADDRTTEIAFYIRKAKHVMEGEQQASKKLKSAEQKKQENISELHHLTSAASNEEVTRHYEKKCNLQCIEQKTCALQDYCDKLKQQLMTEDAHEIDADEKWSQKNAALESARMRLNQLLEHLEPVVTLAPKVEKNCSTYEYIGDSDDEEEDKYFEEKDTPREQVEEKELES